MTLGELGGTISTHRGGDLVLVLYGIIHAREEGQDLVVVGEGVADRLGSFAGGHEVPCHRGIEEIRQTIHHCIEGVGLGDDVLGTNQNVQMIVAGDIILEVVGQSVGVADLAAGDVLVVRGRIDVVAGSRIVAHIIRGEAVETVVGAAVLVQTSLQTEAEVLGDIPLECSVGGPLGAVLAGIVIGDGRQRIHGTVVVFLDIGIAHNGFGGNRGVDDGVLQTALAGGTLVVDGIGSGTGDLDVGITHVEVDAGRLGSLDVALEIEVVTAVVGSCHDGGLVEMGVTHGPLDLVPPETLRLCERLWPVRPNTASTQSLVAIPL